MAQLPGGSFDANQQADWDGTAGGPVIPEGPKMVRITDSAMKPTKAGTGEYLELLMEVLTPEFAGMKHTQRLNLNNPNPQAVDIANRELGAICRAVGKPVIQDSVELHNIPFIADFVVDPPEPAVEADPVTGTKARRARPAQNRIVAYDPAGGPAGAVGGAARPSNPEAASQAAEQAAPAPGPQEQPPAAQAAAAAAQPAEADADEKPPWA